MPKRPVKHRETAKHHAAFEEWYAKNRDFSECVKTCAVSEMTLRNWAVWFGWFALADKRDREAAERADRDAIRRRARMLILTRQAGELMVQRGTEHLAKNPIKSDKAAIAAIRTGSEVWRTAEGLPAWAVAILTAGPEELARIERDIDQRLGSTAGAGEGEEAGAPLAASRNGHQ